MSKRGAENYLTDQNWDKEEDASEEPGTFVTASEDVIKQRPILKAKRRCVGEASDGSAGNVFKGFSGFTPGAGGEKTTSSSMETATSPSAAELQNSKSFEELNKSFVTLVQDRVAKDSQCDLSSIAADYRTRAQQLALPANGKATSAVPLSELFKKSADTWSCSVCMVDNKQSESVCVACTSPKPAEKSAAAASAPAASATSESTVTSSDPTKPSLAELFQKSQGEWDCQTCLVRNKADCSKCAACETVRSGSAADGGKSSEQKPTASSSATVSSSAPSSGFSFGPAGGFSFKPATSSTTGGFTGFSFGSSSSSAFSTGFKLPDSTGTAAGFSFGLGAGAGSTLAAQGFSFKPSEVSTSEAKASGADEDEEYVPPKAESVERTEEGAFYNVRCKLFYKKDETWQDRGVANLFLKPCDKKTQLLIRSDTSIGNILLNIVLTSSTPLSRQGTNNVSLVCVPNPPLDDAKKKTPVCMLIRVKNSDVADELLRQLTECKEKAATE